jgi:predicted membrane-bound dolichyl-phosphate-mannose-protein mannosyltransferase
MKNVGAHKPTKSPNLSACATASIEEPSPWAKYQIAIDAIIDRYPAMWQIPLSEIEADEEWVIVDVFVVMRTPMMLLK